MNTKKDQATPRPWINDVLSAIEKSRFELSYEESLKRNFLMAVKAVNSHDALLEACKLAIPLLEEDWMGTGNDSQGMIAIQALKSAIQQAEKE